MHLDGPVLVFATSGPRVQVGLAHEATLAGGPLGEAPLVEMLGAGQARGRELLPAVERLLSRARLAPAAVRAVVVDVGPGTFTGVRLGVTAAKSLAFALHLPTAAVGSLEALAHAAPEALRVIAVRDAGRGTVYASQVAAGPERTPEVPAQRLEAAALAGWDPTATLVGEDAERIRREHGLPQPALTVEADVAAVLALGLRALAEGRAGDPSTLVPTYLQASAPERLREGEVPPVGAFLPPRSDRPKRVDR